MPITQQALADLSRKPKNNAIPEAFSPPGWPIILQKIRRGRRISA
jgi:hypothetical protein